ncbi:hypothetical protein SELMODRAFT_431950 [Selaginella moellendorffii]|uniref:Uncharacterized protein n=1 Tax=Selaginella moellendorffii TaxID=88036 RepID=D8TEH1_SELML|nr:indole-3-acetate O-methyltransferase 1 [Selaginella moellendorffii]EFJ04926.1 hypothetical protein SELMODRAFT_431950 [Selaginella moellendorffii]|eukprot:XP_002993986.1 indole-3-acetate O-methyltransferase 1 [Selaginella moellendorffii]
MQGGLGEDSYHQNSALQAQSFKTVQPTIKEIMANNTLLLDPSLKVIRIADLGCSNTIHAIDFVTREIIQLRDQKLPFSSSSSLEIQAIFSDTTANDFNTLFSKVPHLQGEPYFFSGVPGSFYHRLFPRSSIHFAMTSHALHYISKIPDEIIDRNSTAWNKDTMVVDRFSPPAALEAFARQASDDFSNFLQHRAQEVVSGGILVTMFPIRLTQELITVDLTLALEASWKDLIQEELLSQESLDTFNLPTYVRSIEEIQEALEPVKEYFKVIYSANFTYPQPDPKSWNATAVVKKWKAVLGRAIGQHIGNEELVELMFKRMVAKITTLTIPLDVILLVLQRTEL